MQAETHSLLQDAWPGLYTELRRLAHRYMNRERRRHTLQATELVHEAYLRLLRAETLPGQDRAALLCAAASAMRGVLLDRARRRQALKRGGGAECVPLDETLTCYEERAGDLIVLNEALDKLSELDPELTRVVELRFFAGLTECEVAEVLGVSDRTVRRSWQVARLWLAQQLCDD